MVRTSPRHSDEHCSLDRGNTEVTPQLSLTPPIEPAPYFSLVRDPASLCFTIWRLRASWTEPVSPGRAIASYAWHANPHRVGLAGRCPKIPGRTAHQSSASGVTRQTLGFRLSPLWLFSGLQAMYRGRKNRRWLKGKHAARSNRYLHPSTRIAADALAFGAHEKQTKGAQLDRLPADQRVGNFFNCHLKDLL